VELEKIKTLDISHNKLSSLPIILLKLKELEVLYVGHNRLSEVPLWFYRLHSVRKLSLVGIIVSKKYRVV